MTSKEKIWEPATSDEETTSETRIQWSNLIFVPFHPIFKILVLVAVLIKCLLGPMQIVYPVVYCWDTMETNNFLYVIKFLYLYYCDVIYGLDIFLHIVHRQVTDKAVSRQFMPKSAFLILVDIISMIPIFRMLVSTDCPRVQIWPNLLAITEFFVIYRVPEYFALETSHSYITLITGFLIIFGGGVHFFSCIFLLLTESTTGVGYQDLFNTTVYDWRVFYLHRYNESGPAYLSYYFSTSYVLSNALDISMDFASPTNVKGYITTDVFAICGYIVGVVIIYPKLFAETSLRWRRISYVHPKVQKFIKETKRRSPMIKSHLTVKIFYNTTWEKRNGLTSMPDFFETLPRYIRSEIGIDLVWHLFHHSPTLRKVSTSFVRWASLRIKHDFKLSGDKFFSGPHNPSNLYFLKSGVVQIISTDEGITPVLSVTNGTLFGDINFYVPPFNRKCDVRCLTYCEFMYFTRKDYITALHKFPADRYHVMKLANIRMKHARTLYNCKQRFKGADRSESEGIAWIKRRWWEIFNSLEKWKNQSKKDNTRCVIPSEESVYHCAKYTSQLILCTEAQLHTKSLFVKVTFPWILLPQSDFIKNWHKIVNVTIVAVWLFYPANLTRVMIPDWFKFFQVLVDLVYAADICVSILTITSEGVSTNFASVMFDRFKTMKFNLDLLSTVWVEYVSILIGKPKLFEIFQLNRLIKIHRLFDDNYLQWKVNQNPTVRMLFLVIVPLFCVHYFMAYFIFGLNKLGLNLSILYFFGDKLCGVTAANISNCDPTSEHVLGAPVSWMLEKLYSKYDAVKMADNYFMLAWSLISYTTGCICKAMFMAYVYLKYREMISYQAYVSKLKNCYEYYKIHETLLKRLERYVLCHWNYFNGAEVMHPNELKNEPYEMIAKVQSEVAENIMKESELFTKADPRLIRDLANVAKFMILPKTTTLLLFGVQCQNVQCLVQGFAKCEYYNERREIVKEFIQGPHLISVSLTYLGKPSLRTYTACTDVEIFYISKSDFNKIYKVYFGEWDALEDCLAEFKPRFQEIAHEYQKLHSDYQKRLRDRIFHARRSTAAGKKSVTDMLERRALMPIEHDIWSDPESNFTKGWLFFRAMIVIVSIVNASLQGGSGAPYRRYLIIVGAFCDCIAWIDIIVKLFLAYYNDCGLLISDKKQCVIHYLTRGFALDLIGCLPWHEVIRVFLSQGLTDDHSLLFLTFCKMSHLYILIGYFNYIADRPSINAAYIKVLKWQLVLVLTVFASSHYLMYYCVDLDFNVNGELENLTAKNSCFVPKLFNPYYNSKMFPDRKVSIEQLNLFYAHSFLINQCGMLKLNMGHFVVDYNNFGIAAVLLFLLWMFWFIEIYSVALFVLASRGNTLYRHGLNQLKSFLESERVETKLIDRAVAHYSYWWQRTKGINMSHITNDRLGVVFQEDLSYFFYKTSFIALDSLLHGGETLGRRLSSISMQVFFLPGEEILRQMDLNSYVFVVHRGKVTISQNGEKINSIEKGSIFGQLQGTKTHKSKISARADGYADLLQMHVKHFQENLTDQIRATIAVHFQAENDYMASDFVMEENPYDTIGYILRDVKRMKLPWMHKTEEARHGGWYSRWLILAWLIEPFISTFLVVIMKTLKDKELYPRAYSVLGLMDAIHLSNLVIEYYNVELLVLNKKCIKVFVEGALFQRWGFYLDLITLVVPLLTFLTGEEAYLWAKVLRIRHMYAFKRYFCSSFKSVYSPFLLKCIVSFLLWHTLACGYLLTACQFGEMDFVIPEHYKTFVNFEVWHPYNTSLRGCPRVINPFDNETEAPIITIPKHSWLNDYIMAMSFILLLQTQKINATTMSLSIVQIYYKVLAILVTIVVEIWYMSVVVSFIYTRFRELYQYDYGVASLVTYLKHNGLSSPAASLVYNYCVILWDRQKGGWLPELAVQAPKCLREDLFSSLYMHHLNSPPLLRDLPMYFKRQLVTRLRRLVMLPGKCIVTEGDVYPAIYFIHEGEVEKWYSDSSGETRLMSVLTTSGFFGLIPGLFQNFPYQFTYYSRTVVDVLRLYLNEWQDLLDGYPEIKISLYKGANNMRKNMQHKL